MLCMSSKMKKLRKEEEEEFLHLKKCVKNTNFICYLTGWHLNSNGNDLTFGTADNRWDSKWLFFRLIKKYHAH